VLAKPGSRIWADRRDATIGFALRIDNSRIAISTAGHLVPGYPFPVEMRRPRWVREDRVERIGTALFSSDPTDGNPGVDVAVIELKEAMLQMRPFMTVCSSSAQGSSRALFRFGRREKSPRIVQALRRSGEPASA